MSRTKSNSSPTCPPSLRGPQDCPSPPKDGLAPVIVSEDWRPIPGHPGYEASTQGRVRSTARVVPLAGMWGPTNRKLASRILTPLRHTGGYTKLTLWSKGVGSQHLTHKLVLWAFVGIRPAGLEACHLNGIKTDNRLCNLKWGSRSENQAHRELHGTGRIGKRFTQNRLSSEMVERVRSLSALLNNTEIARALQMPRTTVNDLVSRRTRK